MDPKPRAKVKMDSDDKPPMRYRSYRRMTAQEQEKTGLITDQESLQQGLVPSEVILGYDPFIMAVDKGWGDLSLEEKNLIYTRCMADEESKRNPQGFEGKY